MKWTSERVEKIIQTTSEICGNVSNGQIYELFNYSKKGILQKKYLKFVRLKIFSILFKFQLPTNQLINVL